MLPSVVYIWLDSYGLLVIESLTNLCYHFHSSFRRTGGIHAGTERSDMNAQETEAEF